MVSSEHNVPDNRILAILYFAFAVESASNNTKHVYTQDVDDLLYHHMTFRFHRYLSNKYLV